jgi:hypothetical protein
MSSGRRRSNVSARGNGFIDPVKVKWFIIITAVYLLTLSILIPIFGATFTALVATPLWGFLFLIYSKWDTVHTPSGEMDWRQLLKPPPFNYWNILWIVLAIYLSQFLLGIPFGMYVDRYLPELSQQTSANNLGDSYDAITDDWHAAMLLIIGGYISHLIGGYIAGKLPNYKCPAPYRHAIFGSFIANVLNFIFFITLSITSSKLEPPTIEDIGPIILFSSTVFLFSALGVKLAVRRRARQILRRPLKSLTVNSNSEVLADNDASGGHLTPSAHNTGRKKRRTSRRMRKKQKLGGLLRNAEQAAPQTPPQVPEPAVSSKSVWPRFRLILLAGSVGLVALIGFLVWGVHRSKTGGANCPNPPVTATLNCWPVTYSTPAEVCHDYPSVDAKLAGKNHDYSQSQEEWERGLTAHAGDEILVLVYINNGAADRAEEINPGRGIARGVRLTTEIAPDAVPTHFVEVRFAGDNTNTVTNHFKINTSPQGRLEVVPKSGEILDWQGSRVIAKDLDVGNNIILVGDLPPKFEDSVFVRFRLRVIA